MIKKRWLTAFLLLYLLAAVLYGRSLAAQLTEDPVDMVAVNRIVNETRAAWNTGHFQKSLDCLYDYTVLDQQGGILSQTSAAAPSSVHEAVLARHTVMDIMDGGQILGRVLILTGSESMLAQSRRHLYTAFLSFLMLLLPPALLYLFWLDRHLIRPFLRLKAFAGHVAAGNLDFPLPMDQGHVFGAFTESFDMMREQLKEARLKESQANQSKKELIASLSHDIKTPVASIKLISELLLAIEGEGRTRDKIGMIYEKADQIDHLVTNLFQASLEDLEEMKVHVTEESSAVLEPMIRGCDYYGKVHVEPVPGCILSMDSLRISQVIGNIIHNSYKYAGTDIEVTSALASEGLLLEFKDYGKGVPDGELPSLFRKFYRGSGRPEEKADGSGLGLYISHRLMERMGGSIRCFNREDGFSVELLILFTGTS